MQYAENYITRRWALLIAFFFSASYLLYLGLPPLSRLEAIAALGSIESGLLAAGDRGLVTYPLYPILVGLMRRMIGDNELAVRLPAVLATIGMAICSGLMAWHCTGERRPVIVASLMTFLPVMALTSGRTASGQAMSAFFLVAAWFSWFYLGRVRHLWSQAWGIALLLVLLAAFHSGPKALVMFYFPLLWLRRPFRMWRRLRMPQHLAFLILAIIIFVLWFHGQMKDSFLLPLESALIEHEFSLHNFFIFPLQIFLLLLPAPFFFWPGFCAAFRSLEKDRETAYFLRILVIPLFVAIWAIPQAQPSSLLVTVPPLAVLAGIHYEILIRRYHYSFRRMFPIFERIISILAITLTLFWGLTLVGIIEIDQMPIRHSIIGICLPAVIAATMLIVRKKYSYFPFWLRICLIALAAQLLVLTSWLPIANLFLEAAKDRAAVLRENLPENVTVYKLTPLPLLEESFYLKRQVAPVKPAAELVQKRQVVWVLGGYNTPMLEYFSWQPASEAVDISTEYHPSLAWFPGGFRLVSVNKLRRDSGHPAALTSVRIYKGNPRLDPVENNQVDTTRMENRQDG